MFRIIAAVFLSLILLPSQFALGSAEWTNPSEVTNWSGKGEGNNQCQYVGGDKSVHGVQNTLDNDATTAWNAHPCRKTEWFLVYKLGAQKVDVNAIQMRSVGNGQHDPRKFVISSCNDAAGTSCAKAKTCTRATNKNYQSCEYAANTQYVKISMNGWGKRGSTWYDGEGANWQYNIQDVQFQVKSEAKLSCGEGTEQKGSECVAKSTVTCGEGTEQKGNQCVSVCSNGTDAKYSGQVCDLRRNMLLKDGVLWRTGKTVKTETYGDMFVVRMCEVLFNNASRMSSSGTFKGWMDADLMKDFIDSMEADGIRVVGAPIKGEPWP